LSLGAGLRYRLLGRTELRLDYAYEDFGVLQEIQMFTVGMVF